MVGALCFAASLFAVPFVGPATGGLMAAAGGVFFQWVTLFRLLL